MHPKIGLLSLSSLCFLSTLPGCPRNNHDVGTLSPSDGGGPSADAGPDLAPATADAGPDVTVAPGCDLPVASQAIAALGLTGVGTPQTLNATLPTALSSDANWGLKATICQQGGFDISALAGQTVCLVGQSIPQACAASPDTVWVVMSSGQVKCLYESSQTAGNPGLFSIGGSYCHADGGPSADAGPDLAPATADAGPDVTVAPGCDLPVASQAIAALGLTGVGTPQTLNATLPTALSSDANWGLKATICQQGGFDISALAGQTVCLVGQSIPQACAASPDTVWVVMSSGQVKCVYESSQTAGVPGLFSVGGSYCQ